jgi:CMP-N-acetylneuraminic acid synthetase
MAKFTAFIPARSGSKRLPNKNIKLLANRPLVVWTLEAFINSKYIDKVIFSTDSMEYWNIVSKYINSPKLTLDLRNEEQAGDNIKIFDYLKQYKDKIFDSTDDVFILALPTAPLRTTKNINQAIQLYNKENKSVFSATNYSFSIFFSFYKTEKGWENIFEDSPMITGNTRSQDQKVAYHPNGAIYIRKIQDLYNDTLNTLYENAIPYIMDNMESIDIDNEIDFLVAEAILKQNKI